MNEKEKKEFYIAMCRCCLLAQTMKTCPLCKFKIGLAEQHKTVDSASPAVSIPVVVFEMSDGG